LTARYDYGPDRLLSLRAANSLPEYYLFDALNSPIALTRRDGTISARYSYDAWGNTRQQSGTSFNRFGFTGHEHDQETGLIYAKARYYDPETARFLSQDPWSGDVSMPPSLHKYLYAYQNPTVYVDPDGRAPVTSHMRDFLQGLAADQREHTRYMAGQMGESLSKDLGIRALNTFTSGGGALLEAGGAIANLADLAMDVGISQNPFLKRSAVGQESAERVSGTIQYTRDTSSAIAQATRSSVAEHGVIGATGRAASRTTDATGAFLGDVFIRGDLEAAGQFQGGLFAAATPGAGAARIGRTPSPRRSGGNDSARSQRVQESVQGPGVDVPNTSPASATRARIEANVAESVAAREASSFGNHARYGTAYDFYRSGGFNADRTLGHLEGIDFSMPVRVTELAPGTSYVQHVLDGRVGSYFAPTGSPAGMLGINPAGRVPMHFTPSQPTSALQSTAARITDTWTVPSQPFQASGGGTQYFVPNRSLMLEVPSP
ncbi:hypothetical protein K8B33_15935, partial [Alcanivorax sp. JB21]|uniref:RHS repeat-associated core domain-containing protein n=1 Tax=Alcanivorax limicola TaxID=2874102 RepID=UPI0021D846B2